MIDFILSFMLSSFDLLLFPLLDSLPLIRLVALLFLQVPPLLLKGVYIHLKEADGVIRTKQDSFLFTKAFLRLAV